MKRINILGLSTILVSITLFAGIAASAAPQANATKPKDVQQGSSITFQITTDTPASMPGTVSVQIMPPENGLPLSASSSTFSGKTVNLTLTIPLNASTGSWRIMRVTFHPSSGGPDKDLTPDGIVTFRVTPHGPIVLPTKASIEIQ